jgi:hypothetical protein
MIEVWHQTNSQKSVAEKKIKKKYFPELLKIKLLVKNCLQSQPLLDYYYKYTTQGLFCILVPQMLKF